MPGPKLAVDIHADASDLQSAAIAISAAGVSIVIPGIASQIIRVWKIFFLVDNTTNITFQDGGNATSGPMPFSSNEGMVLDFDTKPWVLCSIGNAFEINNSGGANVGGTVFYTQGTQ